MQCLHIKNGRPNQKLPDLAFRIVYPITFGLQRYYIGALVFLAFLAFALGAELAVCDFAAGAEAAGAAGAAIALKLNDVANAAVIRASNSFFICFSLKGTG